ncbi:MAG: Asparagine synthetase [Myxococcales bacterium]|nr:Asparagine synthetase [Myxococcales bacterium]
MSLGTQMCGIVGIYNYAATGRDDISVLTRMRDTMVHRGPDDGGVYRSEDRTVLLGHRRLSILDLSSAGHQPMSNADGTIWLTFNGEIYNHARERTRLLERGHHFRSRTDTETIIYLYQELGLDCIPRLDGMFAFGLWDQQQRRLVLARDRLGKKPLYYTVQGGRLLFASEIKALLAHPDVRRDIDPEALNLYLTFANTPAPWTLFAGIHKLPPAHVLTCDRAGRIDVQRYWSTLDRSWPTQIDEAEAVSEVRRLLGASVEKRMMADVPIGCFLSGGVDSSTNVALMSRLVTEPLRTFSVGFEGFGPEQRFYDLPYARQVAKHFGCNHHEIMVTARECQDYLPELAAQQDEPIGDPACLPMHFVSKAAHEHGVKVVLVGEGSDEVFGGYEDMARFVNRSSRRWEQLKRLPAAARWALYFGSKAVGATDGRTDLLRRAAVGEPLYFGLDVVFWHTEKQRLLSREAKALGGAGAAPIVMRYYDELLRRHPGADALQQMSYVELSNRLPELLLMRVDKLSMAHSLEARAPFLDSELVAYGLSLPQSLKIQAGRTKHVLKRAVASLLPPEITQRSKQGFRVPLPAWLAGELAPWAESVLARSPLRKRGLFNDQEIERIWRRHKSGARDHSFDLWCLLNLTAWYEQWIERPVTT